MNKITLAGIILIQFSVIILILIFLGKYIPLEISLQKISSHEYTDDYKCLDFSRDLQNELSKYGIQSEIVIGEDENTAKEEMLKHAWISVWIESQTGEFTDGYYK